MWLCETLGWLGMLLVHGASMPVTYRAIMGEAGRMPPIDMVLMIWGGLFLYLLRAIAQNDKLHIVSNSAGFFIQSCLLAVLVF